MLNFTIYFQDPASGGHTTHQFNFVNGKMNWAAYNAGKKETDPDVMAELLREAQDNGLPAHIAIADDE